MNVCVIGAGTYGSYLINSIQEKYPDFKITLFDVGNSYIKSERDIGYYSFLKKSPYNGLSNGRWFGFGGSSTKWGGQLLTFSRNDFINPDQYLYDIVSLNIKHKEKILKRLGVFNPYTENKVCGDLFTKTGVWLSYFRRDLFKCFNVDKRKYVNIVSNARVIRIFVDDKRNVSKIHYKKDGCIHEGFFDHYFLASGAFEIARLLLNSNLIDSNKVLFSDHLSQRIFKISNGTVIGNEDFVFKVTGSSLITKRLIGEVNGYSFYAHPVLNTDFAFFQSLKSILFKNEFNLLNFKNLLFNVPDFIKFFYSILFKKRMYVLNNEWYMYIDIENPTSDSFVELSSEKDQFDEFGLNVHYSLGENTQVIYNEARDIVKKYLLDNDVSFHEYNETIKVENSEDIYHPYGMFSNFNSVKEYFNQFNNLFIVSTGVLPRAGGINPTAAVLPLIEEYFEKYFPKFIQKC
jgi:hypothetical protein